MANSPQRAYTAACPGCGAAVSFASLASASAVCSYCSSTLVRDGDALRRIGVVGELFDDHSPLQLGAGGSFQGAAFTLVGRLQYGSEGGTWNEWHALFDSGRSGWLSEDNGAYVLAFDAPLPPGAPMPGTLVAGHSLVLDGSSWSVASVVQARLISAQGELPRPPHLEHHFQVADLRNTRAEVATLDNATPADLAWSVGRSITLAELRMSGLAEAKEKSLNARGLNCPSCGNALAPTLASTQSLSCGQCDAVVDISKGVGADLEHFKQVNPDSGGAQPLIPLGRQGELNLGGKSLTWQVVGYLERCDLPSPGDDEEQTFWREYLLYHREAGFAFLVDTQEGWSWARPITGAPRGAGDFVNWEGATFKKRWDYVAQVTWVQGEFYWRVQREERARVTDFEGTGQHAQRRLSREQVMGNGAAATVASSASQSSGEVRRPGPDTEVVWSSGATLRAEDIAKAFGLQGPQAQLLGRDPSPLSGKSMRRFWFFVALYAFLVVLAFVITRCDDDSRCDDVRRTFGANSAEYRQCAAQVRSGGGSGWGGARGSSGGWHK